MFFRASFVDNSRGLGGVLRASVHPYPSAASRSSSWASDIGQRQATHHNPKRSQRQASHLARRALPSTASQAAIQAERERTAQERASATRKEKREKAEEKRQLARLKAKARHRGH